MSLCREVVEAAERSASPRAVLTALDRLGADDRLAADGGLRDAVVAVFAASRALTTWCLTDPGALDVLADLDTRSTWDGGDLVRWQRREYLRIAALDLTGRAPLERVGAALAAMADDVFAMAGVPDGIAVIGMGKVGGRELNYASDVDVMFVGEGDVRALLERTRACFRVDVDLRPEGRDGPLVRSLDAFGAYWRQWASTWEFQALLKARPIAGSARLGHAFAVASAEAVWDRTYGADEVREIRAMKARAEGEMMRRGLIERELKRGRGGIRDIEFVVQLLQLVHGRADPSLRSPNTLDALSELGDAGYVDQSDAADLARAYRFLRTVEHRLQLWDGAQVHAIPTGGEQLTRLARVCGYRGDPTRDESQAFLRDLRQHQAVARSIHERLFFKPLLEAFGGSTGALSTPAIEARLSAFGFTSASRTREALAELTRGLTRTSRLMHQMMPLLLEWLSDAPDPDGGLFGLRALASGQHRADQLVTMFRDAPEGAQRLCYLLGTSRVVAMGLQRHPELVSALRDPELGPPVRLATALRVRPVDQRVDALRRLLQHNELRIQMRDLLGDSAVSPQLTELAESVLTEALELARATTEVDVPVAVIAMGRFGGVELSYASDLDVMVVYPAAADAPDAERLTTEWRRIVNGTTPAERLYPIDFDLRPEGRQGSLARSLASYEQYYDQWAQTWERQALLRGRICIGDVALGESFASVARGFLSRPLTADDERQIRRMKARIERERIPPGDDPDFHLKLGRGGLADVEWTVQLLQLRHGVLGYTNTMEALSALEEASFVEPSDGAALRAAYVFCERARDRLYLVRGVPGDSLPARADELGKLARSFGSTGPELRERYRRVTRRCRAVTERLFYGA